MRFICILFYFPIFFFWSCSSPDENGRGGDVEKKFLKKFPKEKTKSYLSFDSDTLRVYHIQDIDTLSASGLHYGWFNFSVKIYGDSIGATEAFDELLAGMKRGGNFAELHKGPEYIIRYNDKLFSISSGCFNEYSIDPLSEILRSCLQLNYVKEKDFIRIECGGNLVQQDV